MISNTDGKKKMVKHKKINDGKGLIKKKKNVRTNLETKSYIFSTNSNMNIKFLSLQ